MSSYFLSHLEQLENESLYILREVVAEFENPVMLYSIGKDSSVMVRLAQKAFYPGKIPFPLLHVDTGFKFKEMYEFRDRFLANIQADLKIYANKEAIQQSANPFDLGTQKCCSLLKTKGLLDALQEGKFDAAIGGARRDEEKSRAKERVFSFRDPFGQWNPRNQRPELWKLYNTKHDKGESFRIYPLSNWTELDIWLYILQEKIPVVSMYLAKERNMYIKNEQLIPAEGISPFAFHDTVKKVMCRFRSLGCAPCTGAVYSKADTIEKIIEELRQAQSSERANRIIDHDLDSSMEIKKREGYF